MYIYKYIYIYHPTTMSVFKANGDFVCPHLRSSPILGEPLVTALNSHV